MLKQIECETYDRVCGYYRPINQANNGKREEISQRKRYDVNKIQAVVDGSQKKIAADN